MALIGPYLTPNTWKIKNNRSNIKISQQKIGRHILLYKHIHTQITKHFAILTLIELDFPRNVWICMSAKINAAAIEFWYKSYRTCNDINVERFASQNVTSLRE